MRRSLFKGGKFTQTILQLRPSLYSLADLSLYTVGTSLAESSRGTGQTIGPDGL